MIASGRAGAIDVPRRIVLITPAERHVLPALKERGFTGYLVKPVRAASLAARFAAEDSFEVCKRRIARPRVKRPARR